MRAAYFDTFSGISGDMVLGAFISAGVSLDDLRNELSKLPLTGYHVSAQTITRSMISAVKIDVTLSHDAHHHEGAHGHHHDHSHPHEHRSFRSIAELIRSSQLSDRVKDFSLKIFHTIALAEATIHDVLVEEVHFHEVGAVDSIVDIVGAAICLDLLSIEKIFSSVIPTGSGGFIKTQHGTMPVPTPATLEILKSYPITLTELPYELTTPTGAGFIAALSSGVIAPNTEWKIERIGYGAGGREIEERPNLLRLMIGELSDRYETDELLLVETNIDDMNPELYPFISDRLLSLGAQDVFFTPIIMKKGRPGIILSCLCARSLEDQVLRVLYTETTTLGVRIQAVGRKKLPRESKLMSTRFGDVLVKMTMHDGIARYIPEYESCRGIAEKFSLPLIEVYRSIEKDCAT